MKRILIVGATSSIAANVARLYAARGDQLYLLARSEEKLASLRRELTASVVGSECFDFSQCEKNAPALQRAHDQLGQVDVVLIAHGFLGDQQLSESSFEEAQKSILTNYTSVVSQLIELANIMERAGKGNIAVITSVAAERGRPRNYTYGSAKSALNTYLQGLRSRLWPHVHISTIKLGPVDSPMTVDHAKNITFTSSERAAALIIGAIDKNKNEVYVPSYWRTIMFVVRNLPESIFQRLPFLSAR